MNLFYKIFFLFFFLLSPFFFSFSQNPEIKRTYHWYFGDRAGIDFSSGTAVADTNGQMGVYAGCSAISDTAGNLLFYTNGEYVWDRNHDTMPNGTGLYGTGTPYQGSVIIPKPKDTNIYYIFHQNGIDMWAPTALGLHYSVVDMSLNNGLGDVTQKNIQLTDSGSFEQLAAVHHANKCDVWVMTHEHHTNDFLAFLVTENGVNSTPVISVIGNQLQNLNYTPNNPEWPTLSGSKFSNDGKKFVTAVFWDGYYNPVPFRMDTIELFDFDNSSGVLSNMIMIPDSNCVLLAFSPDNTKLYVGSAYEDVEVYQYDISSNNLNIILSTKTIIYYEDYWGINDLQITPDNKMLGAKSERGSVSIIHNPNAAGTACNLDTAGIFLNGKTCYTALPNFIQSYFGEDTTGCYLTAINEMNKLQYEVKIYPNPFTAYTTIILPDELKSSMLIIYDMLGNRVREIKSQNSIVTINRGNLPAGIYTLNIKTENELLNHKLIITN